MEAWPKWRKEKAPLELAAAHSNTPLSVTVNNRVSCSFWLCPLISRHAKGVLSSIWLALLTKAT